MSSDNWQKDKDVAFRFIRELRLNSMRPELSLNASNLVQLESGAALNYLFMLSSNVIDGIEVPGNFEYPLLTPASGNSEYKVGYARALGDLIRASKISNNEAVEILKSSGQSKDTLWRAGVEDYDLDIIFPNNKKIENAEIKENAQ